MEGKATIIFPMVRVWKVKRHRRKKIKRMQEKEWGEEDLGLSDQKEELEFGFGRPSIS